MSAFKLTVIIPAYNAADTLPRCLKALNNSLRPADQIIIVDDCSTDGSTSLQSPDSFSILRTEQGPVGPACARNCGAAAANGDIVIFIDADVAVYTDTLALIEKHFRESPAVDALFGSYDDSPADPGWISKYKNLLHHSIHQHGHREAFTFWAGCGAIRRSAFEKTGGFAERFPRPSIEDIELGYRLRSMGCTIHLCPEIQVTHLKRWTFKNVILTDICSRAVPWTKLIFKEGRVPDDLNLNVQSRLSALIAWSMILSVPAGFFQPPIWLWISAAWLILRLLNRDLYRLFRRKGGLLFLAGASLMHICYLLYSSAVFITVGGFTLFRNLLGRGKAR